MARKSDFASGYAGYIPGEKWKFGGKSGGGTTEMMPEGVSRRPANTGQELSRSMGHPQQNGAPDPHTQQARCATCGQRLPANQQSTSHPPAAEDPVPPPAPPQQQQQSNAPFYTGGGGGGPNAAQHAKNEESRLKAYAQHHSEAQKFGDDASNPFHGLQGTHAAVQPGTRIAQKAVAGAMAQQLGKRQIQLTNNRDGPTPGYTGHIPAWEEHSFGRSYGAAVEYCRQDMEQKKLLNAQAHPPFATHYK